MDEYWYYILFTLLMLFLFESTMAKSRLTTLIELRHARVDDQTLLVHCGGKYVLIIYIYICACMCAWVCVCIVCNGYHILNAFGFWWPKLSGTDLLPGDVVSIGRSSGPSGEEKSVPADMLLLAGSAIANEAILTGKSTPQWKVVLASFVFYLISAFFFPVWGYKVFFLAM